MHNIICTQVSQHFINSRPFYAFRRIQREGSHLTPIEAKGLGSYRLAGELIAFGDKFAFAFGEIFPNKFVFLLLFDI